MIIVKGDYMHVYKKERKTEVKLIKNSLEISKATNSPEEDADFIKETEEAIKRCENGEFKEMSAQEFLKELRKW